MVFENEVNLYGDAPIASKFSSQDTRFDVIQGHVNAIISESEMIELLDGGKTMYSDMNDIKIDVTGLHGNISSLSTTVDGQTQQITQINSKQATYEASLEEFSATLSDTQSDLETTSQNLATLQLDTSQFKTTVSNTYSTKTQAQGYASSAQSAAISAAASDATSKANAAEANANAATDNKLRNYSTTSSVSSMIDQKADEITTSVSRSYATKEEAQTAARTTITGDTIYYLAYANNTGVTTSTSGWTDDPTASAAQISATKKYLWTYHKYTYGDGHTSNTTPAVTGSYGTQGATISKTEYKEGTSPTTAPTGTWSTSVPPVAEGNYLWTRVTYTDGNISYSVAKQGKSGTSVTVSGTAYAYKLSENGTSPPTGTWSPTPVAPTSTQYAWTRTTTTFSDGNTAVTYTVGGKKGDTGVGISKVTPLYYAKNNNTAPAKPSSKITTTTINTGVWTTGLPSLTNTYKYLFTCDQIEYDDSSSHIEWTTVVENKNTADLYTRLTTAEQKITDDAIIQTVSASGQFPAKGEIILAINEVGQSVAKINAEKLELSSYTPIDRFIKETVDKNGSFCGDGAPTTSNYPASLWSDDDTKMSHVGDIYYNTTNGFSYQYGVISGGLLIKFNQDSRTENYYDYVIIYYKLDNVIYASSKFTGNIGAVEFFVPSNEFWVYWHTDTSSHDFYGFSLSSVTTVNSAVHIQAPSSLPDYSVINTNVASDIASLHNPYSDNTNTLWHYTHPTSVSTGKTFSWTRRKDADISAAEASISAINGQIELKASKVDAEAMAKADYIGEGAPTLSNYPASDWANDTVKTSHIGETYYDKTNQRLYYFNGIPNNGVMLAFDSQSKTEPSSSSADPHDYLQIFYSIDGVIFKTQKYYGDIGGQTIKVPSTELWVYWHTDNTTNSYYGFSFSSANIVSGSEIQDVVSENGLPDFDVVETPALALIQSDHNPYKNSDNKLWKYTYYSGYPKDKTFSWTQTEVSPLVDAKTSVLINSEGLLSKVSAGRIASTINQTAQSVLIDAQKINLQGYLTITDVGSGGTTVISGDRITTGTISADRIMGGTLKVGGSSSGSYGKNGAIDIYNSSNARIGRFDCNGLYMGNIESNLTSPRFSVNTDGKINIRLSTSVANTVEMSTQGMICTYPNYYKLAIGSGTQYNAGVRNGTYPLIASRDTTYSTFRMALYNDAILFNRVNSGEASNIFSTKGVVLVDSVQLGMDRNGTEAPGYGARFQHGIYNDSNMFIGGKLQVNGTKNRVVQTSDYSKRLFYSYETASPMFGDVGEGIIGEDGKCYIQIDPIYAETVTLNQYQVFLQKYGDGECYVECRNPSHFVVSGTAGIKFGWEIKAKQSDFDQYRLERDEVYVNTNNSINYIDESLSHIALINEERKPQND